MDVEVKEMSKKEKIKKYIRENRKQYITGSICFGVGMIVGGLLLGKKTFITNNITADVANTFENIDGDKIDILNKVFYKRVSAYGNPIGRPGIKVIATKEGIDHGPFDSMKRIEEVLGLPYNAIREQLHGRTPSVNGWTFKVADEVTE